MGVKIIKVDVTREEAQLTNSGYIKRVFSDLQGGGEVFDYIELIDGRIICLGNNMLGLYKNMDHVEGTGDYEDEPIKLIEL